MKETIDRHSNASDINKSEREHLPKSPQNVLYDKVDERIQQDIDDYNYEYLVQELEKIVWKGSDSITDTNQLTQSTNSTTKNTRPHKTS